MSPVRSSFPPHGGEGSIVTHKSHEVLYFWALVHESRTIMMSFRRGEEASLGVDRRLGTSSSFCEIVKFGERPERLYRELTFTSPSSTKISSLFFYTPLSPSTLPDRILLTL